MPRLGATDLDVFPLCLGSNIFGWTADAQQAAAVLDAYAAAGGNFLDTADTYSRWAPGNSGGEAETIIGDWMAARGNRETIVVATKVGSDGGLGAANIRRCAEASLRRLRTDRIDLYYSHFDDPETPLDETLGAFDALVREGKVRHVGASNISAERLEAALATSDREGLTRYVALQPYYNLLERDQFEGPLQRLAVRERLAVFPYFSLAKGFLAGRQRPGAAPHESPRGADARGYLDARGIAVLAALDEVAAAHATSTAAIALAWLRAQPAVLAPISSARTPEQLAELLPVATLDLGADEVERLSAASTA